MNNHYDQMDAVFQQGDIVLRQLYNTTNKNQRIGLGLSCGLSLESATTNQVALEAAVIQNALNGLNKMLGNVINAFRTNYSILYSHGEKAKKLAEKVKSLDDLPSSVLEDVERLSSIFNGAKTYKDVSRVYLVHLHSMEMINTELIQAAKSIADVQWPDHDSEEYDIWSFAVFHNLLNRIKGNLEIIYETLGFIKNKSTDSYEKTGFINNTKLIVPIFNTDGTNDWDTKVIRKLKVVADKSKGNSTLERPSKQECLDMLDKISLVCNNLKSREKAAVAALKKSMDETFDAAIFDRLEGDRRIWMGLHWYMSALDDLFRGIMRELPSLNVEATGAILEYLNKSIKN